MKYFSLFKMLPVLFFSTSPLLYADTETKKSPSLEEMTPAELKEALKKSHAEIESRLGSSSEGAKKTPSEGDADLKRKASSLSEKRAYETSVQSRIDMLSYKIQSLENQGNKNWGYSQKDAYKLKEIQSEAREQLNKIKSDNADGWKANKQALDSLLRDASNY